MNLFSQEQLKREELLKHQKKLDGKRRWRKELDSAVQSKQDRKVAERQRDAQFGEQTKAQVAAWKAEEAAKQARRTQLALKQRAVQAEQLAAKKRERARLDEIERKKQQQFIDDAAQQEEVQREELRQKVRSLHTTMLPTAG